VLILVGGGRPRWSGNIVDDLHLFVDSNLTTWSSALKNKLKTGFININKENVVKVHGQGNPTDGFNPVKINTSIFNR